MSNSVARHLRVVLAGAAFAGIVSIPSIEAQPLPKAECRLAMAMVGELFKRYDRKLSAQFIASLKSFVANDCDMGTDFKMVDGTDDAKAFGELRVRLIAHRTGR